MTWYVMVGGPEHGTCCAATGNYVLETVATHNPKNHVNSYQVAVHPNLLLHRKLPTRNVMYKANEDALAAYILDALMRVIYP